MEWFEATVLSENRFGNARVSPVAGVSETYRRKADHTSTGPNRHQQVSHNLKSTAAWRPQILELCHMIEKEVQVVFLTATLAPSNEPTLFHAVGVERDMCVF